MCITAECPDPTEVGAWWRDDSEWKPYSKESTRAILRAHFEGTPSLRLDLPIKTPSEQSPHIGTYLIDLSKMEQTNIASGHKREIKLVLPSRSACSCCHGKPFQDHHEWRRTHDSVPGNNSLVVEGACSHGKPFNEHEWRRTHDSGLAVEGAACCHGKPFKDPHEWRRTHDSVSVNSLAVEGACCHGKPFKDPQEWKRTHDSVPGNILAVEGAVRFRMRDSCVLVIRSGSIAEWSVDGEADAVVNPCAWRGSNRLLADETAASSRHGGAGRRPNVAAALHHAAGPKLQEAVQRSVCFASRSGQKYGDAILTPGFNLPASHVLHTFTAPMYKMHDEDSSCAKLEKTYASALALAAVNGMQYLAFPAISCGAGGFPVELAARVALQAICDSSSHTTDVLLEIHFVFLEPEVWLGWMAQASKRFFKVA